jgi:hypothetical protein
MPKIVIVESPGEVIGRDESGALYYGEPVKRPPDRPRVFPTKPQPMPKIVIVESNGEPGKQGEDAPPPKKPRHGKR